MRRSPGEFRAVRRTGHGREFGLPGRDPELNSRQMLVTGDLGPFLHALVSGVGVDDLVIVSDQMGCLIKIVNVRAGRTHRVDVPGAGIHTDVGLHPEGPLVALLRLVHLGVTGTGGILRRRRRSDDRGPRWNLHA
ncbi:hypothetical protein GCM10028799_77260 [Kribbella italica]